MQFMVIAIFVCMFVSAFLMRKHTKQFDKHNLTLPVVLILSLAFLISFYDLLSTPFQERIAYAWLIPVYSLVSCILFFVTDKNLDGSITTFCVSIAFLLTCIHALSLVILLSTSTHGEHWAHLLVGEMLPIHLFILLMLWIIYLIELIAKK